jgi:YHS domain-containing protein
MELKKAPATFINADNHEVKIYVGMPCTYGVGSDSYPAHVSRISDSGKTVWIKDADWKADVEGGHDYFGSQKYIITPSDNKEEVAVRKNKYGQWKRHKYGSVYFGVARYYQDPHF